MTRKPIRQPVRESAPSKAPGAVHRSFLRGLVQVFVLQKADEGPIHGASVIRSFRHFGYRLSPGTLYPLLHALERERLLRSNTRVIRGRSHRHYVLTPRGRATLVELRGAMRTILQNLTPSCDAEGSRTSRARPREPARASESHHEHRLGGPVGLKLAEGRASGVPSADLLRTILSP